MISVPGADGGECGFDDPLLFPPWLVFAMVRKTHTLAGLEDLLAEVCAVLATVLSKVDVEQLEFAALLSSKEGDAEPLGPVLNAFVQRVAADGRELVARGAGK